MKALLLLIALLPAAPTAEAALRLPSRVEIRKKIDGYVSEARAAGNVRDWIATTRLFSKMDKAALLSLSHLPEKMPEIKRRFNDEELVITVEGISVDFINAGKGELLLNGERFFLDRRRTLAETFGLIDQRLRRKQGFRLPATWLNPALAGAEVIDPTCLEGKFEFALRSPFYLMDSNVGYIGKLFVAGVVQTTLNFVSNLVANCDSQVKEMRQILREGNLGIKEIDCGTDLSGNDRSIEFWIPERDEKGRFKTRSFNLDYTLLMAQDAPQEDEDTRAPPKDKALYIFGTTDLQEVRVMKPDLESNRLVCDNAYPKSARFESLKAEIEPFRRIFHYIGEFNSCNSCAAQLLRGLRTPQAPDYFPPVKPGHTTSVSDDEEEEDEAPPAKVPLPKSRPAKAPPKKKSRQGNESAPAEKSGNRSAH